jgi:dephospho-CoA kinase
MFFKDAGYRLLDVDLLVKTRVLVDPDIVAEGRARWGASVIDEAGELDRARVAGIVFGDAAERLWWESVIHPRVGRLWRAELAAEPTADWVVEIPLLFEAGLEKNLISWSASQPMNARNSIEPWRVASSQPKPKSASPPNSPWPPN